MKVYGVEVGCPEYVQLNIKQKVKELVELVKLR